MAIPTDRSDLTARRSTLRANRDSADELRVAREHARKTLDEVSRLFAPGTPERDAAEADLASWIKLAANARRAETDARNALSTAIQAWLSDDVTHAALEPDADFSRLDRADVPVSLFPLRLETRFDVPQRTLKVRIYPDDILSNVHERALLQEERDAGDAYWDGIQPDAPGGGEKLERWTPLAKRFGVPRAAYIVRATKPQTGDVVSPPLRATAPSRPGTAVLPDRFIVLAYKNGKLRHTQKGLPVPEPIDLTADPSNEAPTMVEVADGFTVPEAIAWTMKYDVAKSQGMAIDITGLSDDELAGGFDRVVVLGVKTSMGPTDATAFLGELFDAHHFTRGLALVPQGTPTNNIPGRPTPFTMTEPTGAESFETERIGFVGEGPAPDHLALSALLIGLFTDDADIFRFIKGAEPSKLQMEQALATSMRQALWPATLGYFMQQLMNSWAYLNGTSQTANFSPDQIQAARQFFIQYVCPQGPAPALRVGSAPYGILPALSLSRWKARAGESATAVTTMQRLLPFWQQAAKGLPIVSPTAPDANTALMRVLSQKAGSDRVFIRNAVGSQTAIGLFQYLALPLEPLFSSVKNLQSPTLSSIGHPEWASARAMGLTYNGNAWEYRGPLVTADPRGGKLVSAADPGNPDAPNYLARLADRTLPLSEIKTQDAMPAAGLTGLKPLLYLLLRHSLLLETIDIGRRTEPTQFARLGSPKLEFELWGVTVGESRANVFDVLETVVPASGSIPAQTVFQRIQNAVNDPQFAYGAHVNAIFDLIDVPVRDLERMLADVLDSCAHRLDAWITALATRRLLDNRVAQLPTFPSLNYVGAYGWVENVRPVPRSTKNVPGLGTVDVQPNSGGFVHAPSLRHGTTAAVLRSGRMAERKDPNKYAIELPSERARRARALIEGLRDDQPLGALLGYQFERGMRDRKISGGQGFVRALRKLYPLVANKSGLDGAQPADHIAASNVVDGQKLRAAAAPGGAGIPFGTAGLPPAPPTPSPGRDAILAEIGRLNELMDAMSDLSIAEAVYQVAAGDVHTAQAAMGYLPEGSHPPEPEIVSSPERGIGVSHRVVLLLEGSSPPASPGWITSTSTSGFSPRGQADPYVTAWVGSVLGDATKIGAMVSFDLDGVPHAAVPIVLSDLAISAFDFLALAQSTAPQGQGSALDRRLKAALLKQQPTAQNIVIRYDPPAASVRTLPQALELARALGVVFGGSRELRAADLRRPGDSVDEAAIQLILDEVGPRANTALLGIDATLTALDGASDLRTALIAAADYLPDAFPDPEATALEPAAQAAKTALAARLKDANAAVVPQTSSAAERLQGAVTVLQTIFGKGTIAVMPAGVPQGKDELQQSLDALSHPIDFSDPTSFDAHQAPGRFLQQAARLRDKLQPWRRLDVYLRAQGLRPVIGVAQLPFAAGEDWVGRSVPTGSRTSLLLVSANGQPAPDPSRVWRGLVLDDWTEVVPPNQAETGVAFHYDSQNSEAPQTILLCVHSGSQPNRWNLAELSAIVNETIDLAAIRPVDNDTIPVGQLLPTLCVAANTDNKTVSTLFPPAAVRGRPVVRG